jgi:hypothetical protein
MAQHLSPSGALPDHLSSGWGRNGPVALTPPLLLRAARSRPSKDRPLGREAAIRRCDVALNDQLASIGSAFALYLTRPYTTKLTCWWFYILCVDPVRFKARPRLLSAGDNTIEELKTITAWTWRRGYPRDHHSIGLEVQSISVESVVHLEAAQHTYLPLGMVPSQLNQSIPLAFFCKITDILVSFLHSSLLYSWRPYT